MRNNYNKRKNNKNKVKTIIYILSVLFISSILSVFMLKPNVFNNLSISGLANDIEKKLNKNSDEVNNEQQETQPKEDKQKESKPSLEDNNFKLGLSAFNSKNYKEALKYFNKVSTTSPKIKDAKEYTTKTKSEYKISLINSVDEQVANKLFTKALGTLSNYDKEILTGDDAKQIEDKIKSVTMFEEEYNSSLEINGYDEYTSAPILTPITEQNINTLSIESNTEYLLYENLEEQMTYVYTGSKDNWKLLKKFSASTGAQGQETPKGTFAITGRGSWFYSPTSGEGAKYYIQFMGDYLFHSLPFDQTQTNVTDYTLGKPASHGCVRSPVEEAKWLYENIPNHTKVVIN